MMMKGTKKGFKLVCYCCWFCFVAIVVLFCCCYWCVMMMMRIWRNVVVGVWWWWEFVEIVWCVALCSVAAVVVALVDDDENLFIWFLFSFFWVCLNFFMSIWRWDEDEKEKEGRRWRKLNKLRCWWCTIRFSRHALFNGCYFKKNQTININQINEVFGTPLAMCIHRIHWVNSFGGRNLFS